MTDYKKELNKINEEEKIVSLPIQKLNHIPYESIVLFSHSRVSRKKCKIFFGIGIVYRVVKGEKCDLVYINFGLFPTQKPRLVVVFENHARRQLITLKRGQVCSVYGLARFYERKKEQDGVETKDLKFGLYAKAIQGWYVPTMFDIRKMPTNEDVVNPTEKEENLMDTFEDVLDDFLNGTGDD